MNEPPGSRNAASSALALAAGLMLLMFSCSPEKVVDGPMPNQERVGQEKVRIGFALELLGTLAFIAQDEGYFAGQGLQPDHGI